MSRSKLDPSHIIQHIYDTATESAKVSIQNLDLAIELSADDGDTIVPQKKMIEVAVAINDIIDTSKYSRICMFGQATMAIKAVLANNTEYTLVTLAAGVYQDICVPRIKVPSAGFIILQS